MNNQQKFVEAAVGNHPVNLLFHVDPIRYVRGHAVLKVSLREEFSSDSSASAGVLGLVVDYIARVAGNESIGDCFVLEQEICVHPTSSRALMASAKIELSNNCNAAYRCKVYSVKGSKNQLVGESHGTLISS
jgi:hypothetical protein